MPLKRAFSLIELSIVILVIGIIIVTITQSSRLIEGFKLQNAQSQTLSSPINLTKNLIIWLEPTLERSFLQYEGLDDLTDVTTWKDISSQSVFKNNVTQSLADKKPHFILNCINSLPCLRFDGSDDFYYFDSSAIVNSDYTFVIVEQRRSDKTQNYFIGGSTDGDNQNLHLGYRTNSQLTFAQFGNDYNINGIVGNYSVPVPRIHVFIFSSTNGKFHYLNSVLSTLTASNSPTATAGLSAFGNSSIGNFIDSSYYNGDIAEIAIFSRAIRSEEREEIESYLSKKWEIDI